MVIPSKVIGTLATVPMQASKEQFANVILSWIGNGKMDRCYTILLDKMFGNEPVSNRVHQSLPNIFAMIVRRRRGLIPTLSIGKSAWFSI